MSDTVVQGQAHTHKLPPALAYPYGTVVDCGCGERFMAVPQGIIGAGWELRPSIKTEEEVNGKDTSSEGETVQEGQTPAEADSE